MSGPAPKAYPLDETFQQSLVTALAKSPRLWARIGKELSYERMSEPAASMGLRAISAIAREQGSGPTSSAAVLQRLHDWVNDGKVKHEDKASVQAMMSGCIESGLLTEDEYVALLQPTVQQDLRDQATRAAIDAFGKGKALGRTVELSARADKFGNPERTATTMVGGRAVEAIQRLWRMERLRYGVADLDGTADLQLPRGCLGIAIGGAGAGKSLFLSHLGAAAAWAGMFVAYATLELPPETVTARVLSNLTGVPISAVLAQPEDMLERAMDIEQVMPGAFAVAEFAPAVTTVAEVKQWVDDLELERGSKVDLLIVDYGDKLGAGKKGGDEQSTYSTGQVVYDGLRNLARERSMFCWTASQGTRRKDRHRKLDLDDVADSMHKVRVADVVLTLNQLDEGGQSLAMFVAKNRYGAARFDIGPLASDFARGRIAPTTHGCHL